MATIETLLSRTIKQGECLVWQGHVAKNGYGLVWHQGKNQSVHRVSYELHKGEISDGLMVMHSCDNRVCVNPDHLSAGTAKLNQQDMISKGRGNKSLGKNHHYAKLSPEIAAEIRRRFIRFDRKNGSSALAREFGVSQGAVHTLLRGETWNVQERSK